MKRKSEKETSGIYSHATYYRQCNRKLCIDLSTYRYGEVNRYIENYIFGHVLHDIIDKVADPISPQQIY